MNYCCSEHCRAQSGRLGGSRWGWVLQNKMPCHTGFPLADRAQSRRVGGSRWCWFLHMTFRASAGSGQEYHSSHASSFLRSDETIQWMQHSLLLCPSCLCDCVALKLRFLSVSSYSRPPFVSLRDILVQANVLCGFVFAPIHKRAVKRSFPIRPQEACEVIIPYQICQHTLC